MRYRVSVSPVQQIRMRVVAMKLRVLFVGVVMLFAVGAQAQEFIAGADVSFLRQMEAKGVAFKDAGVAAPGLRILKAHGYNWVRLRVMVNPISLPNDLAYTIASAKDAKALGMKVLLDFHYSDDWADPQHQTVPRAWASLSHADLVKATFAYTRDTIAAFRKAGVMPEMVQVGNEITVGMMWPDGRLPAQWQNFSDLLLAGIHGVDKGRGWGKRPVIMIHIDKGGNEAATKWFFDNLAKYKVPYDVIGQSYYPWWQGSLDELKANLAATWQTYHKDTVVVETAYDWRTGENFKGKTPPFAETPDGQKEFLAALDRVVREAPGGKMRGIFWWEPMASGSIAKRDLFDDEHEALPAIHVFDPPVK
jgi:arabinogalactan endo-1,4-beta-galactosidase